MENPYKDVELQTGSSHSDDAPGSDQGSQVESCEEAPELRSNPVEDRIKQLRNRRFILLKRNQLRNKGDSDDPAEVQQEEQCELEAVLDELGELMFQKETQQGDGDTAGAEDGHLDAQPPLNVNERPFGGVYTLPPPDTKVEDVPSPAMVMPAGSLFQAPALTRCPSCQKVVLTEVSGSISEGMLISCCLCSLMGCIAGCCLIPFFMDNLRDVTHQCPQCQARIHTHKPF